jgi:hypothetical protein
MRQGIPASRVFGHPGLVVGEFGAQNGGDRSVLLHVVEPASTQFAVSLVDPFLLWRVISGDNIRPHYEVALAFHDDNDLMSFFFFDPINQDDMSGVVIMVPGPGDPGHGIEGTLQTAKAVTTAEFASASAQLFKPSDVSKRGDSNFAKFMRVSFAKPTIGSTSTQVSVQHVEWGNFESSISGKLIYALGPVPVRSSTPTRALNVTPAQRAQAFAAIGSRPRPKPAAAPVATVRRFARV